MKRLPAEIRTLYNRPSLLSSIFSAIIRHDRTENTGNKRITQKEGLFLPHWQKERARERETRERRRHAITMCVVSELWNSNMTWLKVLEKTISCRFDDCVSTPSIHTSLSSCRTYLRFNGLAIECKVYLELLTIYIYTCTLHAHTHTHTCVAFLRPCCFIIALLYPPDMLWMNKEHTLL